MRYALLCCLFLAVLAPSIAHATPTASVQGGISIVLVRDPLDMPADITDTALTNAALVLNRYINHDVGNAWPIPEVTITAALSGTIPLKTSPHNWYFYLRPRCEGYNCVGVHGVDIAGIPVGQVGVLDAVDVGASWVTVVSHEIAEMVVDPYSTSWAIDNSYYGPDPIFYALEICDPVLHEWYPITVGKVTLLVDDFVYTSFYRADGLYPYDKMHRVHAPFTPVNGGYQSNSLPVVTH